MNQTNPSNLKVKFLDDDQPPSQPAKQILPRLRDSVDRTLKELFQTKFAPDTIAVTLNAILSDYRRLIRPSSAAAPLPD